jgi:hypothetical protein
LVKEDEKEDEEEIDIPLNLASSFVINSWNIHFFSIDCPAGGDNEELKAAIEQIAELALLGAGDSDLMFPETIEDYEIAMQEELPSRIAL